MKKFGKAGLLILTLVMPALIFTCLRFFTTNHYNIPFYHPVVDNAGQVKVNNSDTVYYEVPNLDGYSFRGKLTVVNYQGQECTDSCAVMRDNLNRIYTLRSHNKDLSILSVGDSVKGGSVNDGWFSSRMSDSTRLDLFKWNYPTSKVVYDKDCRWVLVDGTGHIRGYYRGADAGESDRLMAEIKILSSNQ